MLGEIVFDPQMTTYDQASLEGLVQEFKPKHSLEVGSWKGLSSSIIARHTDVLYCVDTWLGAPNEENMHFEAKHKNIFAIFCNNINSLNLGQVVKALVMSSDEARLIFAPDHLDFIYIDGDHSYQQVKKDLDWWDKLNPGGILAGHDYDPNHPGVTQAVDERFNGQLRRMEKSSIWFIQKGIQ